MSADKKMIWINKELLKQVDEWARENTPLGEQVSMQGSVEILLKTHPDLNQPD